MKIFYLIMAVIGTVIPWIFFGSFFALNGFDILIFVESLFVNGAAGGFSVDVMLSILVFWVWAWGDAKREAVDRWWIIVPAGCLVGLSLALPLYMYLREGAIRQKSD